MAAQNREKFGSRLAVIAAMAGSAIGLGNIWRFPYMVGEHGGAAFILLYIVCTVMVSLPVFIAEMSVGRRARTSSYGAMNKLKAGRIWHAAGVLSVIIPLVIASYYSVIGGWSLDYLWRSLGAEFVKSSPDAVTGIFGSFISTPGRPIVMHLVFLAACAMVVAGGVKGGIERFSKFSIPVLFVLILVMMV